MAKSYYGCCGFCKHCRLETAYTWCYSTSFTCDLSSYKHTVKADEKPCSKFDPDKSRTNEIIAKYDK